MHRKPERGVLLVLTMVVVFIVSAISGTLLSITTSGTKREQSRDIKFKAREIAVTGLNMSLNMLRQATDGEDNDGDGTVDEGIDEVSLFAQFTLAKLEGNLGRLGTLNWTPASDTNGNGLPDFGEAGVFPVNVLRGQTFSYTVFSENDGIDNDEDGTTDESDEAGCISIIAQSRYNGFSSQVKCSGIFTELLNPPNPPTWFPDAAFISGGDITVTGNCDITGLNGSVHSNGFMDLGGSSNVVGDATASGGGNIDPGNVGGNVDTNAPEVDIPDVSLANMQAIRDQAVADGVDVYILNIDGTITKDGAVVADGTEYHGWKESGGDWSLSSSKADLDGLFYVIGSVKLTGGKQGISMTVLAEGNIEMSGNGEFTAYYDETFLVSLMDIAITGTPQQTGDLGIVIAREQVKTSGNAFIRGTILAADLDDASGIVDTTTITGNFDIEYNGGFSSMIPFNNSTQYKLDPTLCTYEER